MGGNRKNKLQSIDGKIKELQEIRDRHIALYEENFTDHEEIIKSIKDAMVAKGIGYASLARLTGLGRESLYKIIPYKNYPAHQNPTLYTLLAILKALKLRIKIGNE